MNLSIFSFSLHFLILSFCSSSSHSFSIFSHPGCKDAASCATLLHAALMQIFQFLGWKQIWSPRWASCYGGDWEKTCRWYEGMWQLSPPSEESKKLKSYKSPPIRPSRSLNPQPRTGIDPHNQIRTLWPILGSVSRDICQGQPVRHGSVHEVNHSDRKGAKSRF